MHIKFCGADREVTGSCHLVILDNGYRILLDCGMYQGHDKTMDEFNEKWLFSPSDIDYMVLSHAHIDHCGRIPRLVKDGYTGKIVCTHATRSLVSIMLMDAAHIQEMDAEWENKKNQKQHGHKKAEVLPLYTEDDVQVALPLFVGIGYEQWFDIGPGVQVCFRDAGHILGSASVMLKITENGKTTMLGFSGDIGRPNRPILKDPIPMDQMDYLLCESTYGDSDHEAAPNEVERLLQIINETAQRGGKVIIPAFSLGRTQEIIYMLDQMWNAGKMPKIPVFVDSPLAVNATDIFRTHPECFDAEMLHYLLTDSDPWGFQTLSYIKTADESKKLNDLKTACVIISASGMANAGRIRHHLFNNIADAKNTVLIVGYCSPETTGGQLRAGAQYLTLFGKVLPVNCKVEVMDSFSAHADRGEIKEFIKNQFPGLKKLFLVHGDYKKQLALDAYLKENGLTTQVEIPTLGQEVEL